MPKGEHLKPYVYEQIMVLYRQARKRGLGKSEAYKEVATSLELKVDTVAHVVIRLTPTTGIAQDLIKAKAFRLAARIVRKANVQEAVDILSRPNIGVLAPKSGDGGGGGGFFLSVSADTCGSVRAVAGQMPQGWAPNQLPPGDVDPEDHPQEPENDPPISNDTDQVIEMSVRPYTGGEEGAKVAEIRPKRRGMGHSAAYQEALERAKQRIADARALVEAREE